MHNDGARIFGLIGLGRMGGGIARHALRLGFSVVGRDNKPASPDLKDLGLIEAPDLEALVEALPSPCIVVLYVPAGPTIDNILDELSDLLDVHDVVVDGGNSYWGDSIRRHARLKSQGIEFVDAGTSGGPGGALNGACFMVGGDREPVAVVEPLLQALAVESGYVHAGGPGAGHFVKLVHNGIEFGMLQAIAEGIDLLERYGEKLQIANVLRSWRHGSVIRSWLIDLIAMEYRAKDGLANIPAYVEDTGEVAWLVEDALRMEVPIPVIAQSVIQLISSRDDKRYWARAIAMMRHRFGDYPYGPDPRIARERRTGRVGDCLEETARRPLSLGRER